MSATTILLQAAILGIILAIFIALQYLPKQALTKHHYQNRATIQSKSHLIQGSHLLARARSTPHKTKAQSLAKTALNEAEMALSISPKDPAALILKGSSLEIMGHKSSALKSLVLALSSPRVKSLADRERGDALVKRAELKLEVNKRRRVDSAVEDLEEAIRLLSQGKCNPRALCLLGECYELKGRTVEAKRAFEEALEVEPGFVASRQGLARLGS
ncbi:TPR_11 domain-containing protein [Cephalotus follicularis]|uniref:TPR_11 domain-containing protein n=1 Tax=Cephalotus follicularis TaxID=3775 RepID=A0A1Q3BPT6_CEPFO|nr:TPR_11 domain-containing protein [Cephalotus follicularis]